MRLKNIRVTLSSVNRVASKKTCEVVEVKTNYKRLDDNTSSREPESYSIVCAGNKFDTFGVKVLPEIADKVTQVCDALRKEQDVEVEFQNLRLSLYALVNNGTLYSGVSGKADNLTIISTTDTEDEEIIL